MPLPFSGRVGSGRSQAAPGHRSGERAIRGSTMRCAVLPDVRLPSLCPSSEQSTAFSPPLVTRFYRGWTPRAAPNPGSSSSSSSSSSTRRCTSAIVYISLSTVGVLGPLCVDECEDGLKRERARGARDGRTEGGTATVRTTATASALDAFQPHSPVHHGQGDYIARRVQYVSGSLLHPGHLSDHPRFWSLPFAAWP